MIGAQRRQTGQLFTTTTTCIVSDRVVAPLLSSATVKDQPLMGLHTMYACLSGVKPRCALTPACQKTNPKGLLSLFDALISNYALAIIVMLAHLIWPTNHSKQISHPSTYKASHQATQLQYHSFGC